LAQPGPWQLIGHQGGRALLGQPPGHRPICGASCWPGTRQWPIGDDCPGQVSRAVATDIFSFPRRGGPRPSVTPGHPVQEALGPFARGPLGIDALQGVRRFAPRRPRGGLAVGGPERPAWPGSPCPAFGPGPGRVSRGHMPDNPLSAWARGWRAGRQGFFGLVQGRKGGGRTVAGPAVSVGESVWPAAAPQCQDDRRAGGPGRGSIWRECRLGAWEARGAPPRPGLFLPHMGPREAAGAWPGRHWALEAPKKPGPRREPGSRPLDFTAWRSGCLDWRTGMGGMGARGKVAWPLGWRRPLARASSLSAGQGRGGRPRAWW
jgi:hypothetical protein